MLVHQQSAHLGHCWGGAGSDLVSLERSSSLLWIPKAASSGTSKGEAQCTGTCAVFTCAPSHTGTYSWTRLLYLDVVSGHTDQHWGWCTPPFKSTGILHQQKGRARYVKPYGKRMLKINSLWRCPTHSKLHSSSATCPRSFLVLTRLGTGEDHNYRDVVFYAVAKTYLRLLFNVAI